MKKAILSLTVFGSFFIGTYLILCYLPGMRIKLFADPMEYLIESIKHAVLFKFLVSVAVGMIAGGIRFKF